MNLKYMYIKYKYIYSTYGTCSVQYHIFVLPTRTHICSLHLCVCKKMVDVQCEVCVCVCMTYMNSTHPLIQYSYVSSSQGHPHPPSFYQDVSERMRKGEAERGT